MACGISFSVTLFWHILEGSLCFCAGLGWHLAYYSVYRFRLIGGRIRACDGLPHALCQRAYGNGMGVGSNDFNQTIIFQRFSFINREVRHLGLLYTQILFSFTALQQTLRPNT